MEITKEAVEKRLKKLQAEYQQLTMNMAATDGAIQDCNYWLDQLEKEVEPDKEKEQ